MKAAVEIVAERGFSGASIDAIAERSGVARSTIYRHWPQRMDLLLQAVGAEVGRLQALVVGDLRTDLIAISTNIAELLLSEPVGSACASMILESRRDPSIDELLQRFVKQRKRAAVQVIEKAIARGEIAAGSEAGAMVDDLVAPIFFQALVLRVSIGEARIEKHIDRWLQRYGMNLVYTGDRDAD